MLKKILNKRKLWSLIDYVPTQNQLDVHDSTARFRVNIQGRRSGKSFSAAAEALPYLLTPNTRGWVVAPNYELCDKVARLIKVARELALLPYVTTSSYKQSYNRR